MKEKVAIIGGGIAGLTAAYLLNQKFDITLFEKDSRLGGNAYTIKASDGEVIDIAVAVFGKVTYKNFFKLLSELNIKTQMMPLSFVSMQNLDTKEGMYLTPFSVKGLFAQNFALFKPRVFMSLIRMYISLVQGMILQARGKLDGLTMREALDLLPYLKGDAKLLLMFPLCVISSMYYEEILDSPAEFFFGKFWYHHDLVSPEFLYAWRCAANKTKSYVDALAMHYSEKIVLSSTIKSVARSDQNITLRMKNKKELNFDKIVFACNADQALELLEQPTDEEIRLLGAWKYKDGAIVVHKDNSSFPERDLCQAFTFLYTERDDKVHTSVTGCIWHEAGVPDDYEYFSSQHPNFPIRKDLIDYKTVLRTPIFDTDSVPTIEALPTLNGKINSYYCGSHFGYGLHEDAVKSAVTVAHMLGVQW